MARWVRGPFNTVEELHDALVESLINDSEQLIKVEQGTSKEMKTVTTITGHIHHLQLHKSGDDYGLSIYWGPVDEDPQYISSGHYLAGIKFWVEE